MTASGIKLADANVWLALAFDGHAHHASALQWCDLQVPQSCALCRVTQMALLRHLTNPKIMQKFVQSQQTAWQSYDVFARDPRVVFLTEPPELEENFRSRSQYAAPRHDLWTDLYLAALATLYSAQVVTFDRDFTSFPDLDVLLLI